MAAAPLRADAARIRADILRALRELHAQGKAPDARELAAQAGVGHGTARRHVDALRAAGVVTIREVPTTRVRQEIVLLDEEARP